MNILEEAITYKKERIRLSKTNDGIEHIFLTIINNKEIFKNSESRILALMIFNLCQDSLTAIRIGNYNLVTHYKYRIESILFKLDKNTIAESGINTIIYPMYSYYDYKRGEFNDAESCMTITINSLRELAFILKKDVVPPLLEQYKNLILIYLRNNQVQEAFGILEYILDIFKDDFLPYTYNINEEVETIKNLYNNIIDEILLKVNSFDKENYKFIFDSTVNILHCSKLYLPEKYILEKYLSNKLEANDSYKIIAANFSPVIEGTFLNSIKYIRVEEKELIDKYFVEAHNINISL